MTHTDYYYLPAKAGKNLLERDFDKLRPVVTSDGPPRGFLLIDTFDGAVRKSGRLLMNTGDTLELLSPETGILRQSSGVVAGYVAEIEMGDVKEALSDVSPLRALQTIGTGDIQEVALAFVDSAQKTRVRARLWFLHSNAGGAAALVILQGLRGYDKALNQVRTHIAAAGATQIGDSALYAALFPGQPLYTAKPDVMIGSEEAAFDAANDIIATYLPIARVNEPGIVADIDIEFLHDYRIALRKIRSVLSLFRGVYDEKTTASLKARFSDLMSETGQLRDLDVYLAEKDKFYSLLPETLHAGLHALFDLFSDRRAEEQERLRHHLESASYAKEMDALKTLFGKKKKKLGKGENADLPALKYSSRLIWKRYRKVCEIASGIDDKTEDEEVHKLRIHCKKLRYLMEFFGPVFPKKEFNSILRPLKRLQDNLGLFNDYSVQQDSLHALLDELNKDISSAHLEIAQSVGALIVVLHRKQVEERDKVVESFAKFNDEKTNSTFRALFKNKKVKA